MDRFDEWLREQGIEVAGQAMTGSGNMLLYRLRLVDGHEFDVSFPAETLMERPSEAIARVQEALSAHEEERWRARIG
jgi:hypothetical protein